MPVGRREYASREYAEVCCVTGRNLPSLPVTLRFSSTDTFLSVALRSLDSVAGTLMRLTRHQARHPASGTARYQGAVTSPIAALPAMAEFGTAIAHLRNVLGEATYESLARKGETMTTT